MERGVGGGIGMGNTCKPMAVSFQCMTKSTTNKIKKKICVLEKHKPSLMISMTLRVHHRRQSDTVVKTDLEKPNSDHGEPGDQFEHL